MHSEKRIAPVLGTQPCSFREHEGFLRRRCRRIPSMAVYLQKYLHRCRTSGASTEQQATHVRSGRDLRVERDQGQAGGVGKRAEVRIGPEIWRGPRTFGERLPRFEEFNRL